VCVSCVVWCCSCPVCVCDLFLCKITVWNLREADKVTLGVVLDLRVGPVENGVDGVGGLTVTRSNIKCIQRQYYVKRLLCRCSF